jgi:hypothetical protein
MLLMHNSYESWKKCKHLTIKYEPILQFVQENVKK